MQSRFRTKPRCGAALVALASVMLARVVAAAGGPPSVTLDPAATTVGAGTAATFTATADDASSVKWQVTTNGGGTFTTIPGATSPTFSFTASLAQNGNFYRAIFSNAHGSVASLDAELTVYAIDLSIDDATRWARYGGTLSYSVNLANPNAFSADGLVVTSALSSGLDATTAHWECTVTSGSAACPADGTGELNTLVDLPAQSGLTWLYTVTVDPAAPGNSVTAAVAADGATTQSDTDRLCIFRDGFD